MTSFTSLKGPKKPLDANCAKILSAASFQQQTQLVCPGN